MSFVVVYQGQFKPYVLPDASGKGKVARARQSSAAKELKDHEDDDFENILSAQEKNSSSRAPKQKAPLQAYQKAAEKDFPRGPVIFAKDIMSSPVHFLRQEDTLQKAWREMEKTGHRHFPVLDNEGVLRGVLSERDLFKAPKEARKIKDAMTPEALTALDRATVQDLARIMLFEKINCLPVIDERHNVVGIVTNSDILNYVLERGHLETRA